MASLWWRYLRPAKRQLVCLLVPLLLLPIPLIGASKTSSCAYVVIWMAFLWVTELLPLAITALLPIVAFPVLGIVSAKEISLQYFTDTNCVFIGSLIMAIAVETSNLHERIALRILLFTGSNPRTLMLGFQLAACLLSMWISNTATTAMMLPIVIKVISELERCRKQKSRTHESDIENGGSGIIAVASSAELVQDELDLDAMESADRSVYKGLLLSICYAASIGGTGTLVGTGPNLILVENLGRSFPEAKISFAKWMLFAVPSMLILLAFCWIWLQSIFIGFNFNKRDRVQEKAVEQVLRKKYDSLGPIRFDEVMVLSTFAVLIVLWLTRSPGFTTGWGDLYPKQFVTDGTAAMAMSLLLFVLPAENPFCERRTSGEYKTLLTWSSMNARFSWSTILLLGGGFAMAKGVKDSGLSDYIGSQLTSLETLPQWLFVSLAAVLATFLTEFSSNVATSSIFLPIVISMAKSHGVNPLLYTLPVTVSCSFAFMFPAGTPPNAIVFSARILRVRDMAWAGSALNLFALTLTMLMTYTYTYWLFDLGAPVANIIARA